MRNIFVLLIIVWIMAIPVQAADIQEELFRSMDIEQLEEGLTKEETELLDGASPKIQTNLWAHVASMVEKAIGQLGDHTSNTSVMMGKLLLIAVLCQLADALQDSRYGSVVWIAGSFAVVCLCVTDLNVMAGLGTDTIERMTAYSNLLLPVMASASTAAGAATSSAALYSVTVFFSNLFLKLSNGILVPGVYACLGLALADSSLQKERLKQLRELLKWLVELGLRAIGYGFTAVISITGALSGSTDTALVKSVRSVIAAMVPVVGGIISGATDAIWNGAVLVKNSIGMFGLLAILAIVLIPFLRLAVMWFMFRVLAAICGVMESKLSGLFTAVSGMMGILLGMVGCCAWILLLSCFCFLKVVAS